MREILFRGKRLDNGEWAESQYPFGTMYDGVVRSDFDPDTIGQFIGLTDKNGKKIFEGDILARLDYYGTERIEGVVKYGEFNCSCCDGVYGWYVDGGDIRNLEYKLHGFYVKSNIHDNPELLEE